MSHLYVLVRADLTPEQQAVQAAHAAIEAARELPSEAPHPSLVICAVPRLEWEATRLQARGLQGFPFTEPDMGGKLTAIAYGPLRGEARKVFAKYNLMRSKT